ncbi:MAG: pantoate--beta-alanine ligase [Deltaproteobacteria bacterium]|nr:pantoate--beta-alanine ligase [Deltaproteobacteria bacterium]
MPDVATLRATIAAARAARPGLRVALVPTMGALHAGHLSLVDRAREAADVVVVSIFVNPTQFAAHEDLDTYPRTMEADLDALASRAVEWVFAPSAAEMYPTGFQTEVRVPRVATGLCATSRPHFFGGVALVVLKLLNAAMADVAVFGEKDWQQLQVIRRMVLDLNHPTQIVGAPLIRDPDGLAMSSRNAYLDATTRAAALALPRALQNAAQAVAAGARDVATLEADATRAIAAAGGRVDYVTICDEASLERSQAITTGARIFAAATFGSTRLIDNVGLLPGVAAG